MTEQSVFTQGSLSRHIVVMSLTTAIGLMAVFMVDFVDLIFISMLGKAELAAAIGYAAALLFFATAIGLGIAIAAGALVARALGANEKAQANERATASLGYALIIGVVFATLFFLFLDPLVSLVGGTGGTHQLAVDYLIITIPSIPFLIMGMVNAAILRAHGGAGLAMWITIWAGVINGVLDPLLIFGLNWDLQGAATATTVSRVFFGLCGDYYVWTRYRGFAAPTVTLLVASLMPVLAIAVPAMLAQFAMPIGQVYLVRAMSEYGEEAVAAMAVITRLTPVAFAIVLAMSGAIGPIFAQNFGAAKYGRVQRTFWLSNGFAILVVVAVALLLFVLRAPIASLFNVQGLARDLVYLFCGPLALAYVFNAIVYVATASFDNLGKPMLTTWINWGRYTIGTIVPAMIGAWLFGAPGILIGDAVGAAIFAAIAFLIAARHMADCKIEDHEAIPSLNNSRFVQLFRFRR